jgi:hypothetical protein
MYHGHQPLSVRLHMRHPSLHPPLTFALQREGASPMNRRVAPLLEPGEPIRFLFSTRHRTDFLNEGQWQRYFGSSCLLAVIGTLAGIALPILGLLGVNITIVLIDGAVFAGLLILSGVAFLISLVYNEQRAYCFTDRRLIALSNKPGAKPLLILYREVERLALYVRPDALRVDSRPETERFAEFADRFNHPERWPQPGGMKDWFSTWDHILPTSGNIRLYGRERRLIEIYCAVLLRERVEIVRQALVRTVEIEGEDAAEEGVRERAP